MVLFEYRILSRCGQFIYPLALGHGAFFGAVFNRLAEKDTIKNGTARTGLSFFQDAIFINC